MNKERLLPEQLAGVELTLKIGCPLDCHYCPQKMLITEYTRRYGKENLQMRFEDFETILSRLIPGAGIAFTGMSEPFMNPDCAKMIRMAADKGFKITLATTLVGMKLEDFELIKDIPFDNFILHIPDQENNSKFRFSAEYKKVLDRVLESGIVTRYSCHGTVHSEVADKLNKEISINSSMMNRAGNLDHEDLATCERKGRIICNSLPGWVPEVLPNGTVLLCCQDYGMKHILGNLIQQTWREIVCGEEYIRIEEGMREDDDTILCRKCVLASEDDGSFYEPYLFQRNEIELARAFEKYVETSIADERFPLRYQIFDKILQAKSICIFGLGKLFTDNYINSSWKNFLQADYLCDNDQSKWGRMIDGCLIVPPNKLAELEGLLVITYIKDNQEVCRQLQDMGITNILSIYDIFSCIYK